MNNKETFISSIKRGTGEAYLLLQAYPDQFVEELLDACTTNYAYEAQSEGCREEYLFELILLSNHSEILITKIKEKLKKTSSESWDGYLLYELAKEFTLAGDLEAEKLLFKKFLEDLFHSGTDLTKSSLIEATGYKGLEFVVDILGQQYLESGNDRWIENLPTYYLAEALQEGAERLIYNKAETNSNIKAYLEALEKKKKKKTNKSEKTVNYYQQFLEILDDNDKWLNFHIARKVGETVSSKQLDQIAHDLLKETDPIRIKKYLTIFSRVKFPFRYEVLLNFEQKLEVEDQYILIECLSFFSDDRLTQLAIKELKKNPQKYYYLDLFKQNQGEDVIPILMKVMEAAQDDEDDTHDIGYKVRELSTANPSQEFLEPLMHNYNYGTCSICREGTIQQMIALNILPKKIKTEAYYDCNPKIRNLMEETYG